jgi:hypothetical protein
LSRGQASVRSPTLVQLALGAVVLILIGVVLIVVSVSSRHDDAPRAADATNETTTSSSRPASATSLISLRIAPTSHAASYDRAADFGGFVDVDGCRNTRAELLIRTSAVPATFTRASDCTVRTGRWTDPWSGVTTTVARDLQIDHTVPLANAWRSGAWAWTHAQRIAYANDLSDATHLAAILGSENESKGDSGPDAWKPPSRTAWCTYARVWDRIKAKWNLSATSTEWNALVAMAATC